MNWLAGIKLAFIGALLGALSSCGGGGGGSAGPYSISLSASTTQLALNLNYSPIVNGPSLGGPYTATLYVDARDSGGRPISPAENDTFACSITNGLDSGALYYLDGKDEHQFDATINGVEYKDLPSAYRSITLPSNAGSASFHLHAYDVVGAVTVRCSVREPITNIQRSAQITIQVGGPASGKASQILVDKSHWTFPGYLFVQGLNGINQGLVQASIIDEAGQPVRNPAAGINNLQARIVPSTTSTAEDSALLRGVNSGNQTVTGAAIQIASYNGQAQFSLISGNAEGSVVVEVIADRSDNNVGNGIGEPVYNYFSVPIVTSVPGSGATTNLAITTTNLPAATGNVPYGALLEATGGTLPYAWSLLSSGLPFGLSLSTTGVISGTPYGSSSGSYSFAARVTDARGATAQGTFTISYTAPTVVPTPTLQVSPSSGTGTPGNTLNFVITGGLPNYAVVTNNASVATAALTFSGSQYIAAVTLVNSGTTNLIVTDSSGQAVSVPITVTGGSGTQNLTITPSVGGTVAIGQAFRLMVTGGAPPYTINSTNTSIGTVTPATLPASGNLFTFNPQSAGTVRLIIIDSAGTIQTVDMTVTQPGGTTLTVLPASVNWTTPPSACATIYNDFVVYGGAPPYTAYSTSPLIVTIPSTSTGPTAQGYYVFRAQASCGAEGTAELVFRDQNNALVTAIFNIDIVDPTVPAVPALVVNPSTRTITEPTTPRTLQYVVSGGTPPYQVTSSDPADAPVTAVTLSGTQYVFSTTIGTNVVGTSAETYVFVVNDANLGTALSNLTVTPSSAVTLAVSPSAMAISDPTVARTFNYVVTGGTPPYQVSSSNSADASVSAVTLTGSQYGFTATINADVVQASAETITFVVTDANGASVTSAVTVSPPLTTLAASPSALTVRDRATPWTLNFVVTGGTAPYSVTSSIPSLVSVGPVSGGVFTATVSADAVIAGGTTQVVPLTITDANNRTTNAVIAIEPD